MTTLSPGKALRSRCDDLQTHCAPVDRQALRDVLPWGNERFTTRACPPLCPVPVAEVVRRNPSTQFTDLTGQRFGALTVVGLMEFRGAGRSLWAVRCDCGMHERRQWKTLVRSVKRGRQDACHWCTHADSTYNPGDWRQPE